MLESIAFFFYVAFLLFMVVLKIVGLYLLYGSPLIVIYLGVKLYEKYHEPIFKAGVAK